MEARGRILTPLLPFVMVASDMPVIEILFRLPEQVRRPALRTFVKGSFQLLLLTHKTAFLTSRTAYVMMSPATSSLLFESK